MIFLPDHLRPPAERLFGERFGLVEQFAQLLASEGPERGLIGPREVERLWEVVAPVLEDRPDPEPYAKGSWRPQRAIELAEPVGWRLPEPDA